MRNRGEDNDRVVPLPPPGTETPVAASSRRRSPAPWIGAVIAVAVVATALALTNGDEPPIPATPTTVAVESSSTSSTSTTMAPPVALSTLVPGLSTPMVVVYGHGREMAVARWHHDASAPNVPDASSGRIDNGRPYFNADATSMAWTSFDTYETLWLGHPHRAAPMFIDTAGVAWHPDDPRQLAWVGRPPGSELAYLYRVTLPPVSPEAPPNPLDDVEVVTEVPRGLRLLGWGNWGYALTGSPAPGLTEQHLTVTQVLHPDGQVAQSVPGLARAVSSTGDIVISGIFDDSATAIASGDSPAIFPPSGRHAIVDSSMKVKQTLDRDVMGFDFSPDGSQLHSLTQRDGGTLIETLDVANGTVQESSIDRRADFAGYADGGRFLVLYTWEGPASGLIFHDIETNTNHEVPFPNGVVVGITDASS